MISRSSLFEYTVGALFFAAVGFSLGQTGIAGNGGLLAEVLPAGCTATVSYSMHPSTPFFRDMREYTTDVVMGVVRVNADEAAVLNGVSINVNGPRASFADGTNVSVWDGITKVGSARVYANSPSSTFYIPLANVALLAKTDKALTIRADLGATSFGDKLVINVIDVSGYTVRNSAAVISSGSTNFAGVSTHGGVPVVYYGTTTTRGIANGVNDLASFMVSLPTNHGPVTIEKLTFEVATSTASVSKFMLIGPTGPVSSSVLTFKPGTRLVVAPFDNSGNVADRSFTQQNPTKMYTLRATDVQLTGANGTGSVSVTLKADPAYKYGRIGFQPSAKSDQYVVWSQSSTTPSGVGVIWANSFGLPGCFTLTSPIASDCPAITNAK